MRDLADRTAAAPLGPVATARRHRRSRGEAAERSRTWTSCGRAPGVRRRRSRQRGRRSDGRSRRRPRRRFRARRGHGGAKRRPTSSKSFSRSATAWGASARRMSAVRSRLGRIAWATPANNCWPTPASATARLGNGPARAATATAPAAIRCSNVGLYGGMPPRRRQRCELRQPLLRRIVRGSANAAAIGQLRHSPAPETGAKRRRRQGGLEMLVPSAYRRRVAEYFQRIADETGGEGSNRNRGPGLR